jgi:hypothetical protein
MAFKILGNYWPDALVKVALEEAASPWVTRSVNATLNTKNKTKSPMYDGRTQQLLARGHMKQHAGDNALSTSVNYTLLGCWKPLTRIHTSLNRMVGRNFDRIGLAALKATRIDVS